MQFWQFIDPSRQYRRCNACASSCRLQRALLCPISPAARTIAVRPSSYLDDIAAAPAAAAKPAAPAPAAPRRRPAPAPAPVAAAPPPPPRPPRRPRRRSPATCPPLLWDPAAASAACSSRTATPPGRRRAAGPRTPRRRPDLRMHAQRRPRGHHRRHAGESEKGPLLPPERHARTLPRRSGFT